MRVDKQNAPGGDFYSKVFRKKDSKMPSHAGHSNPYTMACPLCGEFPEKKSSKGGYEYFGCECGDANEGWTTDGAVGIWNYLVEERQTKLSHKIAKKLGII